MGTQNGDTRETLVVCQSNQGVEIHATLLRLTHYVAVFEIYSSIAVLRTSEVLNNFRIMTHDRAIYSGRAVIRSLVNTGVGAVCEAALDEGSWMDVVVPSVAAEDGSLNREFEQFLQNWRKLYRILPEYKVVVADMQSFLADLRMWLDQVELGIRSAPAADRVELEQQFARHLGRSFVPAFDTLHERLEAISDQIDEDLVPAHRSFAQRQLHPLMLCSPFAYRAYHKPLGYAGDYEMVNMIGRNPFEGASLFAKIVNLWFLSQWPSKAHRNRLEFLSNRIQTETLRVARSQGVKARIFDFGCGPAIEVQNFLRESPLSDHIDMTLADFNTETLDHAHQEIAAIQKRFDRAASIRFQKKSVHQILREGHRPTMTAGGTKPGYDMIYCAGLFDYLSDAVCKQLTGIFYEWLAPGGLLTVTNVVDNKPFRHMLEFVLDWHLIYRNAERGTALVPDRLPADAKSISSDDTGVNLFIEVRKPSHA